MSISSDDRIAGPFSSGTVLPFDFKVFQTSDVRVVKTTAAGEVLPDLVAPTEYSVALNSDQDTDPGGEVTLVSSITGGDSVVVTSDIANTQPTTITNLGGFLPATLNTAFDRQCIQLQQLNTKVKASIQFPVSDANTNNVELPTAGVRANKYLAFDSSGDPVVNDGPVGGTPPSTYGEGLIQVANAAAGRTYLEVVDIPYAAASASGAASLEFAEDTDNGANKVTLKAPASLPADADVILPPSGTLATLAGTETLSSKSIVCAAGSASLAPITLTSGTNLTTATAGATEYDGKVKYFTPQGTQRGIVPTEQFFRLDAALVGANGTSAQNALGVSFGVSAGTIYEFEGIINLSKSAGTTSHSFSWLFGGTASINNISYQLSGDSSTVSFTSGFGTRFTVAPQVATAIAAYTGLTSASLFIVLQIKGTISVNVGGTLSPQYILSAAPGGAYTTAQGSFFKIKPIGASGANVSVGNIT